jgi:hypothetical protein
MNRPARNSTQLDLQRPEGFFRRKAAIFQPNGACLNSLRRAFHEGTLAIEEISDDGTGRPTPKALSNSPIRAWTLLQEEIFRKTSGRIPNERR